MMYCSFTLDTNSAFGSYEELCVANCCYETVYKRRFCKSVLLCNRNSPTHRR